MEVTEVRGWGGAIVTTPANNNLVPNNQALSRQHFIDLYKGKGRPVPYHVVEVYLQFICEYVNRMRNRNAPGQIPVCAVKDARFFRFIYDLYIYGHENGQYSAEFSGQLTRDGLEPHNFLEVRHLFLIDRSIRGHMGLIVISPQARSVELLDSAVELDDNKMGLVFRLLSDHLGPLFHPHEWRVRQGFSPKQGNTDDCTIYVMTNAMLIALGYPVQYCRSDMRDRRYRIAADLLNGGIGMLYTPTLGMDVPADQEQYQYELADYWTGRKASDISRGFRPLNPKMLSYLAVEVQEQARAEKYLPQQNLQERKDREMCRA